MLPQNVEEAGSHGTCGGDVSAAADLADFGADDFCDSGPAGQTDDEGETQDGGLSQCRLKQEDDQQTGNCLLYTSRCV